MDYHFDAMQPDSYQRLRFEVGSHVIVVTPLFELADVIIPLAVKYAKHVACCRVPCQFLNERRQFPARDAWLKKLQEQRRLLVVYPAAQLDGLTLAAGCVWLVVFASEEQRALMGC